MCITGNVQKCVTIIIDFDDNFVEIQMVIDKN